MKKKISLEVFLAVIGRGICQMVRAIGRAFSYKNKTPFWRVIGAVITVCAVLVTGVICYSFFEGRFKDNYSTCSLYAINIDGDIYFRMPEGNKKGYVFNGLLRRTLLKDVEWATCCVLDSVTTFQRDGKWGFFNAYTGKVLIPPTYSVAFPFSEGLAAVVENDSVHFIHYNGKHAFPQGFEYNPEENNYLFNQGVCIAYKDGKKGLINKKGEVCVPLIYDYIEGQSNDFYIVGKDGKCGVLNNDFQEVFPCEYKAAKVSSDRGIYLTEFDYSCKRYTLEGELIDDFVVGEVNHLLYDTDTVEKDGDKVYKPARCLSYATPNGTMGLMSKDGHPITAPLFVEITAIGEDLYLCQYDDSVDELLNGGVVMNSRGEIVRKK